MKHRLALILPTFLVLYTACYLAAFLLRYEFSLAPEVWGWFRYTLPVLLAIKFTTCLAAGEWRRTFRHAALPDLQWMMVGATVATVWLAIVNELFLRPWDLPIPRSVLVIDWVLSISASGLLRMAARMYTEGVAPIFARRSAIPTLIYGAGREGIAILRAVRAGRADFRVVGLVSDGPRKQRSMMAGVRVYSKYSNWGKLARKTGAAHVLAPGSTPGREIRELTRKCGEHGLKVSVIPDVQQIVENRFKLSVRDVTINDLLRREPAVLDMDAICQYVTGRRVLVTGGAGSIGSELCRQILTLSPASLVLVDQSEFGMFQIECELRERPISETPLDFVIADVTDRGSISRVFDEHRPQLVFHAAAYKHVPLMEHNPREAVRNNIGGTRTVADVAAQRNVERFVLISTDKAVRPTSVMGASKLIAEKYVQSASTHSGTQFVTVRFGNVLNSAGSVVPTFRRQIEAGGPVTVTHPDMTRFFMTIPEAVQLVLQAGAVGQSGDVLILEMGEPVKIVDLAKDMIALSGLKCPEDIDIAFTGMRPGEKLYEELFYESEAGTKKVHDKIYRGTRELSRLTGIESDVARLEQTASQASADVAAALWDIVARYVDAEEQPTATRAAA